MWMCCLSAGGILHSGRHGSAEVKRGSTTLQVSSGKNDENYMTLDFGGEKTSSTISTSRRLVLVYTCTQDLRCQGCSVRQREHHIANVS